MPEGVRIIIAGQDLVRNGEEVEVVARRGLEPMKIVETAIANARLTISVLLFLMLAGAMAYVSIPKEAEPDIQIPILYVSMRYDGISPEDSERLLLRPMETALKSITGIKKMTSTAYQGGGNVLIEFQAGADLEQGAGRCAQQGGPGPARTARWGG